jgi:hypothetical protein
VDRVTGAARYHLALVPDRGDGQPDTGMNPVVLALLPGGTRRLVIDAHWQADGPGGSFRGGITSLKIDLEGQCTG